MEIDSLISITRMMKPATQRREPKPALEGLCVGILVFVASAVCIGSIYYFAWQA